VSVIGIPTLTLKNRISSVSQHRLLVENLCGQEDDGASKIYGACNTFVFVTICILCALVYLLLTISFSWCN